MRNNQGKFPFASCRSFTVFETLSAVVWLIVSNLVLLVLCFAHVVAVAASAAASGPEICGVSAAASSSGISGVGVSAAVSAVSSPGIVGFSAAAAASSPVISSFSDSDSGVEVVSSFRQS